MVFKRSNETACTICSTNYEPHKMTSQLLWCTSLTCADLSIYEKCNWLAKVMTCKLTELVCVYELDSHVSSAVSPKNSDLTRSMRTYVRDIAKEEAKPACIRSNLIETLNLECDIGTKFSCRTKQRRKL